MPLHEEPRRVLRNPPGRPAAELIAALDEVRAADRIVVAETLLVLAEVHGVMAEARGRLSRYGAGSCGRIDQDVHGNMLLWLTAVRVALDTLMAARRDGVDEASTLDVPLADIAAALHVPTSDLRRGTGAAVAWRRPEAVSS